LKRKDKEYLTVPSISIYPFVFASLLVIEDMVVFRAERGTIVMEERIAKLQVKLESDQDFANKLFSLETPEEVQNLLKEQGIDFSLEEINILRDMLVKALEKGENGELSDEALEGVAGGWVFGAISAGFAAASFTHNVTRGRW